MKIAQIESYRDDIVKFAEDFYYLSPGKRIILWDYQKDILREINSKDENGDYKYRISIISLPRQNSKSELSTIIGLHSLFFGGWGNEVLSVGIGGKQTGKVIFNKARKAIMNSPVLYESIGDKHFQKNILTVPELMSTWEIAAAEMLSTIGRSFDTVLMDELGNERVQLEEGSELYDSITAGQSAKPNARIIVTSTVGGQAGKLWDLLELSKQDKKVFCFLSHENLSPLITNNFLKRRKKELHPSVYKHWHENRFFSGDNVYISPDVYDNCVDKNAKPVSKMPDSSFAISWCDIGLKRDSSVVVTVYRDANNKINIAEIKSWSPKLLKREIQLEWIEEYLMDIKKRLNVRKIYLDEWQGIAIIQRHGKRLNIEGVHLTSDKLERIWSNFIALMQNEDVRIYDDRSDDIREMRKEALNLTIQPKGPSFKIIDRGSLHQDRILSFAGACWKMVEGYERERYNLGSHNCYLSSSSPCPLYSPGQSFFALSCHRCDEFWKGFKVFSEAEGISMDGNFNALYYHDQFEKFCLKIGGFNWSVAVLNG